MKNAFPLALLAATLFSSGIMAQQPQGDPKATEVWEPVPKIVTPAKTCGDAPSDAIVLFDGKNLDQWVSAKDGSSPAQWTVDKGGFFTVKKGTGNIQTKKI